MIEPIRRLNDQGRNVFLTWLENGGQGSPPLWILDDRKTSDPLGRSIPRPDQVYNIRYDLGVDLVELLDQIDVADLQLDTGIWDWMSLLLIDQICPSNEGGSRKIDHIDRYLLQPENHQTRYRHLVRSAWNLVRVHGSTARLMLSVPLHVHGEIAEQLGAYQDVITCKPLIAAIGSLVWDERNSKPKRGFAGRGPGSARRVQIVAKQFRLTYDLDSMRPDQILELLPAEFNRFRGSPAGRRLRRQREKVQPQHAV